MTPQAGRWAAVLEVTPPSFDDFLPKSKLQSKLSF
jgi:hypothetical protein